jgi:hypothetical protein
MKRNMKFKNQNMGPNLLKEITKKIASALNKPNWNNYSSH